jgi:exonuclease 3'-5' domain-containing protein 1
MDVQMINDAVALKEFLDGLPQSGMEPNLYIDLEGNNLSRNGTISLITILVEPRHTCHLVDVHVLGKEAFTTSSTSGVTLQQILESKTITKAFFDIRNDSDALFHLFGISVAGIEDLQLMELGSRRFNKKLVNGLSKCIELDASLTATERQKWKDAKEKGNELFNPSRGGSYAVFDQRPLTSEMEKYCVQDVIHLPALRQTYWGRINNTWKLKVDDETTARIELPQSAGFNGKGKHMAEGPKGWQSKKSRGKHQQFEYDDDGYDDDGYDS